MSQVYSYLFYGEHVSRFGWLLKANDFAIRVQHKVESYRVDFLVECHVSKSSSLIVECDGHDYHDKTKEQARKDKSRDRAITSLGLPVFRFTGSEIWGGAFKCADQVVSFLWKQATDRDLEESERESLGVKLA